MMYKRKIFKDYVRSVYARRKVKAFKEHYSVSKLYYNTISGVGFYIEMQYE